MLLSMMSIYSKSDTIVVVNLKIAFLRYKPVIEFKCVINFHTVTYLVDCI